MKTFPNLPGRDVETVGLRDMSARRVARLFMAPGPRVRVAFLISALSLAFPAAARSQDAGNVDLSWNDCVGAPTAALDRNFACTGAENQTYRLMVQFRVNQVFEQAGGFTAYLQWIDETTSNLGDPGIGFWRLESACAGSGLRGLGVQDHATTCGDSGITIVADEGTQGYSLTSVEWFSNVGRNGFHPGVARIIASHLRVVDGIRLDPDVRYYLLHLEFNNRNRNACAYGCTDRSWLILEDLKIESFDRIEEHIQGADRFSDWVTINGGSHPPTATTNTTWGRLKALYR